MNKYLLSLIVFCLCFCSSAFADEWDIVYPQLEKSIVAPQFPDKTFDIRKYGAAQGKSPLNNTKAINKAIKDCSKKGGGKVLVPAGVWDVGAITLLSNVNLVVSEGATLRFVFDVNLYPVVETRWEGLGCYNVSPLIYANGQKNIAITGKGTIDGGGTNDTWWYWTGVDRFGWKEGMYNQRNSRAQLQSWSESETPVSERRFTKDNAMRPQTVNFMSCERVLIEDVTFLRSPFWVLHPVLCNDLTVRGVTIINSGPNGDGCDPESCNRVLIENCLFRTGDDCIAIKGGRNKDGRMWNIPCQNIIVRNCRMEDGHGGIVVGSEISGGFCNLFCENCQMDSPNLDRVVRIKTNTCRGGIIENIFVRNVEVGECREAVLKINLNYEPREKAERGHIPAVRNVHLDNVNCHKSKYGAYISGLEDSTCISDVSIDNCTWTGIKTAPFRLEGLTRNISFNKSSVKF